MIRSHVLMGGRSREEKLDNLSKAKVGTGQTFPEICRGFPPPPTLHQLIASSLLLLAHRLVSHQTGSPSFQAQTPGWDLTKQQVKVQGESREPKSQHILSSYYRHISCDFI